METSAAHERLAADGLIARVGATWRTTRRWQAAMMRAALRLQGADERGEDLRIPVALALLEIYGEVMDDEELCRLTVALLPIEQRELTPPRGSPPEAGTS
jgi:hypothetical protein